MGRSAGRSHDLTLDYALIVLSVTPLRTGPPVRPVGAGNGRKGDFYPPTRQGLEWDFVVFLLVAAAYCASGLAALQEANGVCGDLE